MQGEITHRYCISIAWVMKVTCCCCCVSFSTRGSRVHDYILYFLCAYVYTHTQSMPSNPSKKTNPPFCFNYLKHYICVCAFSWFFYSSGWPSISFTPYLPYFFMSLVIQIGCHRSVSVVRFFLFNSFMCQVRKSYVEKIDLLILSQYIELTLLPLV